jgi:hypothetical protein
VRRASPPPTVVATSTVVEDVQEQLLGQEEELFSREGSIVAWEDGLATYEGTLGRVCLKCDAERTQTEVVHLDYLNRSLTSSTKHSLNFNRMLEVH